MLRDSGGKNITAIDYLGPWRQACLVGALAVQFHEVDEREEAYRFMELIIYRLGYGDRINRKRGICPVGQFNDHELTTWEEVQLVIELTDRLLKGEPIERLPSARVLGIQ